MKLTEKEVLGIVEEYKKQFPKIKDTLTKIQFSPNYDVVGKEAWIVTGESELLGDIWEFWYVVSDKTAKVEYTFDKYGNIDPHIDRPMPKEWEDYVDEDEEDND